MRNNEYSRENVRCGSLSDDPTFPTLKIRLFRLTGIGERSDDIDIKELKRSRYQTQIALSNIVSFKQVFISLIIWRQKCIQYESYLLMVGEFEALFH